MLNIHHDNSIDIVLLKIHQISTFKKCTHVPWFLRCLESPSCSAKLDPCVLAVKNDLQQDGHVDQDLDRTAHPELSRALVHHEVDGLEDVAGCPQHHHLHTHAFGGAVVEVLQQLWEAQHGLEHDGQGAQRLHEHGGVQQQQGDDRTQHGEAEADEQVVLEHAPLPEVAHVQV